MALNDLRDQVGSNGRTYVCYLVDPAKRITSNIFNVWIPSLMGGIDNSKKQYVDKINSKASISKSAKQPTKVQVQGYIQAYNMTGYGYRLDGFIPHFKVARMTMATGTAQRYSGSLSGPTTAAGCGPHTHQTTGNHTYSSVKMKTMEYKDINLYMSTEVDLQNINNKVIKRGHKMLGVFPEGEHGMFYIIAIDNVTPRLDSTSNDGDSDRVDSVTNDGKLNPKNQK